MVERQKQAQAQAKAAYEAAMKRRQEVMMQRAQAPQRPAAAPRAQAPAPAPAPAMDAASKEKWTAARQAFWKKDMAKAEELYKALLSETDAADVAGELGNVYFTQRRMDEAADMFLEAGVRMLNSDNPRQSMNVMRTLMRLDQNKAQELRTMMHAKMQSMRESAAPEAAPAQPKAAQ